MEELEHAVYTALETYSNVHRGSGHNSMVSTHLFEQARDIILEYLGLNKRKYVVIFCTPRRAEAFCSQLKKHCFQSVSSRDIGLPLGLVALAVDRRALAGTRIFETGGGTTRLISPGWVVWAGAPDRYEAGTPAIVNVITFARALQLSKLHGKDVFRNITGNKLSAEEILYDDELKNYLGKELLVELRKTLIGRDILVPTKNGERLYINLDNGASTPTFMPVWNTVCQTWHQTGQVHKEIINEVRSICYKILGASDAEYDIIFTSNTTEAINLVAESLSHTSEQVVETVVLNTLMEHSSNELPWRMIPQVSLIRLPIDAEGFIDLNEMEAQLCEYNQKGLHGMKRIKIVAVTGASNVLGVFNDLKEISELVHKYGAHLLVDGAQMVAHRYVGMDACGIDYLAFSAHKAYAPFGTGVLVTRKGLLSFGEEKLKLIKSSGEENVAGIAALGKSFVLLQRIGLELICKEEQDLVRYALQGLEKVPGLTIYGIKNTDSPKFSQKGGVIVFGLKGFMANRVAKELAEMGGIGVRYGCHCAHLLIKHLLNVPPALEKLQRFIAMSFRRVNFPGLVRVSMGIENNTEDIDRLIEVLENLAALSGNKKHPASGESKTASLQKTDIRQKMKDFTTAINRRVYSTFTDLK